MKYSQFKWKLVDDCVRRFNDHRRQAFIPSEMICIDESISKEYEQGDNLINIGLLYYVAINRNHENGCEIKYSCCGVSGIVLRLKHFKQELDYLDTGMNEETT